jgi:antitoxin (DNA-binding transcriptional repressor) of toxin-antitoxin stability system
MPSIDIRQLRNTKELKAWLRAGKTVELSERGELIARIVPQESPPKGSSSTRGDWPDFEAMRKGIFGDRILAGADIVIEERGRY